MRRTSTSNIDLWGQGKAQAHAETATPDHNEGTQESAAKVALQKASSVVQEIRASSKKVSEARLARSLGLSPDECETAALSKVLVGLRSCVAEVVQDESTPNLVALQWRYICINVWCNGMQLVLTHVASPLEDGRQVAGPVMQHPRSPHLLQAWPTDKPPKAVARQCLIDLLHLPTVAFDSCFDTIERTDRLPAVTEDTPSPGLPGLKMETAITNVLVQIKNAHRLSALGLPQGASFSTGGSRGHSYWAWRHIETFAQPCSMSFLEVMRGRIDDDELQGLAKKLGTSLRLSWLRRPVFDFDTMLLSVQRIGEKMPLPPCILQLGPKLGVGAVSHSTAVVLNALADSSAHPKGDILKDDGGNWGALQLVLPNFCWGEDSRMGESSLRSLRDLVRDCYDAGIRKKLPRELLQQQDRNTSNADHGSDSLLDDTLEILRDVFGVHGPLAKLMACDPADAGIAHETDIFEAHCIEDIIDELSNVDPLPPAALESLPWASQKSTQTGTSPTDNLIATLEKLMKLQEKLTERIGYKKKPWCARSCLSHGSLDSACVLVSGLRQFWLAGFDDDAGPTEAPLIDSAQLCTSLLLEDCQLPVNSKLLPALVRDTGTSSQELADWLQVEEAAIADMLEYEMSQTNVRAFRTVVQVSKFASKMSAVVHKDKTRGEANVDELMDAAKSAAARPRARCRLRRSSTENSKKSNKTARSRHRAHRRKASVSSEVSTEVYITEATTRTTVYTTDSSETIEAKVVQGRKRHGSASAEIDAQLGEAEKESLDMAKQPMQRQVCSEPDLGKRHHFIVMNKRSDAKDAFMEAVRFSQALVERIPACLLGEPIGPPPDGLVSCFSKALLWAWEVQGVALSLMADRLSASAGGVFITPVSGSDATANAKIIASGMLPLLLASVNVAWNVSPWQRPWALLHAEMIAKKLAHTIEEIVNQESKGHKAVTTMPVPEVLERTSIVGRALPEVHFEQGHRLLAVDPLYCKSDDFYYQQRLKGDQVVRRAVFGSVGATVGGCLDSDEDFTTDMAKAFLGFPCSLVGIGIEESRESRRGVKIPDDWDPPARHRVKVRKQNDLFSDKLHQRLDGTVIVPQSISSDRVEVTLTKCLPDNLLDEPHEFRFRCGDYFGRGEGYIWETEHKHRIMTNQALMILVNPEDHFIQENVMYSWCFVSDDGTVSMQGENGGEAVNALQKMLTRINGVQTFAKGNSLPGTLYYMSYRTEVMLDPLLIIGQVEMQGMAEAFFPSRTLTLVPGGVGTTLEQQEASRAGVKLKQKRCMNGVVHVKYAVTFSASRNITLYPAGARIRIFSQDCCQNEGPSATVLELQASGEYSIRLDGSGEVRMFDPDDWNHEVAGVYRYAPKQRLVIHQNGAWINATVVDCVLSNYHALEIRVLDAVKIIQMDLNEMNHGPAWLSVLEFERIARRYTASIKEKYGFVSDPVTGQSMDILKQPFCVSRLGAQEGRDAWLDLASTLEPPKQRASGVLETDGVLIWGQQGSGKSTLARRLAVGCIHSMGGLLPILVSAGMLMEHLVQETDPLDMVLWQYHGGGGVATEIYVMLRQAVYCRRVALIIDEADGASKKWWPLISYLQCLVDLGHTVVILATPGPDGPKSISQKWLGEVHDSSNLIPKSPAANHGSPSRPASGVRRLTVPTSIELPRSAAVNLLELEIRPLTADAQRDAVAARLGNDMVPWFETKFTTASDFCKVPFGLAFLLGYAAILSSNHRDRNEKELYLVEWLQSAIDAILRRCLRMRFNACNQEPKRFESRLSCCAQVLEMIGMEARRLSCHELPFDHLADLFRNESRDIHSAWKEIVALIDEGQLKLIVGGEVFSGEKNDRKDDTRSPIRFNHDSLRDYFAARCVMRCLREGRQSMLPPFETILFDSTWDAYLRFIFELVELNQEPVTLDFSEIVLGPDRMEQLNSFFVKREWRCPCLRLELAGKDNLPNVEDLDALLLAGSRALDWLSIRCSPLGISGIEVLGKAVERCQPALIHLDLRNCTVGADGMEVFARYLAADQTLTYLNVGSNQLGAEGAAYLAKALQHNAMLEVLLIENNGIGSEGAESLVNGIVTCSRLLNLGLSTNRLGDDGSSHAAELLRRNSVVRTVDVGINNISDVGMQVLSSALLQNTTLEELSLDGNEVGPAGAWHLREVLLDGAMLQSISLEHIRLGAEGVAHLSTALRSAECKLQHVELRGNRLGLPGAKQIAAALSEGRSLRRIGLSSNALHDGGMILLADALKVNMVLEEIDLSENRIGVEGAKALAAAIDDEDGNACNELRRLQLQGNRIGPKGAEIIADAFSEGACPKLVRLEIGNNAIEDKGAFAFANVLQHMPTLQIIEMQRNRIGFEGAQALVDAINKQMTLQKLLLHGNFVGDKYFPFIEDLCQVRTGRTIARGTRGATRAMSQTSELSKAGTPLSKRTPVVKSSSQFVASHFKSGLQVEVLNKLKRLGLPQPKPLGDMLDRIFGDSVDSPENQDWITASPNVLPRKPYLQKSANPKSLPVSGKNSEADSKRSSSVSIGGDLASPDEVALPPPSTKRRVSLATPSALDTARRVSDSALAKKSARDLTRRASADSAPR